MTATPYSNATCASYDVNTDGTLDLSVHTLENVLDATFSPSFVHIELIPPASYDISGTVNSTYPYEWEASSDGIKLRVDAPDPGAEVDVPFGYSITAENGPPIFAKDPTFKVVKTRDP